MVNADDKCGVCGDTRENHGDKHHEFNMEGNLLPLKPAPAPQPNKVSPGTEALRRDPLSGPMLRLVERLIAKNLLDGEDLLYVFGGIDATDRRSTEAGTQAKDPG